MAVGTVSEPLVPDGCVWVDIAQGSAGDGTVEIAAVYYIVLAVVVFVMGLRMVRKVDLSKD